MWIQTQNKIHDHMIKFSFSSSLIGCIFLITTIRSEGCWRTRRLAGATAAQLGDFPYLAVLLHPEVRCTGSIISVSWILSAAHCTIVDGRLVKASEMAVVAGVVDFNQTQSHTRQVRYARQIFPHPNFEELKIAGSDVALIKLDHPFEPEGIYVSTIQVSGEPFPVNFDVACTASGWGDTRESSTNSRLHKLSVVAVQSRSVCHGLTTGERKKMICLKSRGGAGLCDGDSGGPLVCNNRLVGVAHQVYIEKVNYRGPSDMDCGSGSLVHTYMFVCPFLDWMKGHVPEVPDKPKKCFTLSSPQNFDESL